LLANTIYEGMERAIDEAVQVLFDGLRHPQLKQRLVVAAYFLRHTEAGRRRGWGKHRALPKEAAEPQTVISVLRQMKAAGKGVIGMKILGAGALRHKADESLQFALSLDCVDCFTIGAESRDEMLDLTRKIPAASVRG